MNTVEFINRIRPGADQCEAEKGIPAGFTIAQAALESAWGGSGLTARANNLFGIKAGKAWHGEVLELPTREVVNGSVWVTVNARWRKYATWADCLLDHADFFHVNLRYSKALEHPHDSVRFAEEVAAAGYATDPNYAKKIINLMNGHHLE